MARSMIRDLGWTPRTRDDRNRRDLVYASALAGAAAGEQAIQRAGPNGPPDPAAAPLGAPPVPAPPDPLAGLQVPDLGNPAASIAAAPGGLPSLTETMPGLPGQSNPLVPSGGTAMLGGALLGGSPLPGAPTGGPPAVGGGSPMLAAAAPALPRRFALGGQVDGPAPGATPPGLPPPTPGPPASMPPGLPPLEMGSGAPAPEEPKENVVPHWVLFEIAVRMMRGEDPKAIMADIASRGKLGIPGRKEKPEPTLADEPTRDFPDPPQGFIDWLNTVTPDATNDVGEYALMAYQAKPQQVAMIWDTLKQLAKEDPKSLPPELLTMTRSEAKPAPGMQVDGPPAPMPMLGALGKSRAA